MKQQNYSASITANVPVKDVFEKIGQVPEWWGKDYEGSAQKPGDTFTIRFGATSVNFKIAEVIPDKKIVWDVTDCNIPQLNDKKEWKGTKIDWELSTKNNMTQINFTHIGMLPEIECFDMCMKGWDFFIKKSFQKFITEGKGLPDTPTVAR